VFEAFLSGSAVMIEEADHWAPKLSGKADARMTDKEQR
jgi:hypothetical protein